MGTYEMRRDACAPRERRGARGEQDLAFGDQSSTLAPSNTEIGREEVDPFEATDPKRLLAISDIHCTISPRTSLTPLACPLIHLVAGHIELANAEGEGAEDVVTDGYPAVLDGPHLELQPSNSACKGNEEEKEERSNKLIDLFVMFGDEIKECD